MAEYGKPLEPKKQDKPATKNEQKLIDAYKKQGKIVTLEKVRRELREWGIAGTIVLLALFGGCVSWVTSLPEVDEAAERCRMRADLDTRENGSSAFRYAEAVSRDQALLHFRHPKSGRMWTTNYPCD